MTPLRVSGTGYGRFSEFNIEIPTGCVALVGPNGSGKSRLLQTIQLALFANGSRDLAPWVAPWADRMQIEMEFLHDSDTYRVRRTYKTGGRGTATLDLEIHTVEGWAPLTRETTKATQDLIERTLGMTAATFAASSFLTQGDAGAFPEADATSRKQLLGEILDPSGLWPTLAELAQKERRTVERNIVVLTTQAGATAEVAAQLPMLTAQADQTAAALHVAETAHTAAETQLDQARQALNAAEAAMHRARAATDRANNTRETYQQAVNALNTATMEADGLAEAIARLHAYEAEIAQIEPLETLQAEQTRQQAVHDQEKQNLATWTAQLSELERAHQAALNAHLKAVAEAAWCRVELERVTDTQVGEAHCDRCDQILGVQARAAAIASLTTETADRERDVTARTAEMEDAARKVADARNLVDTWQLPDVNREDFTGRLRTARQALTLRSDLAVHIARMQHSHDQLDQLRFNAQACKQQLDEAVADAAAANEMAAGGAQAVTAVSIGAQAVTDSRATLDHWKAENVRIDERRTRAAAAADELRTATARIETMQANAEVLRTAERAYGRDGVPAYLVEHAVPTIEAETNRILELLPTSDGVVLNVEITTQKTLKSDTTEVRETLDILVADQDGVRPYETFSGGEKTRLNIALRIALARLLTHRQGAESRLLAIDEPEYLDQQGQEGLVEVIQSVAGDFDTVIVVSHVPDVRDAFDTVIEIVKSDGVSEIAGREAEVAA